MADDRKNSIAKLAANRRYDDKSYDKITIRVRKDAPLSRNVLQTAALQSGISVNELLLQGAALFIYSNLGDDWFKKNGFE